jgi:hypothetical protein
VVREVVGGRVADRGAGLEPLGEGHGTRQGDALAVVATGDQCRRAQREVDPPVGQRPANDAGAPLIQRQPRGHARRAATGVVGGVGEGGNHRRTDGVSGLPRDLAAVDVDLEGRGVAHHPTPVGTEGIEMRLHGAVAARVDDPLRVAPPVEPDRQDVDVFVVGQLTQCGGVGGR